MTKVDESDALHVRARAFVDAFERGASMPEAFDVLAKDVADFQARNIAGYARLREARGEAIPAVPTDAFKVARVSVWEESETPIVFRTSGTTVGARGAHWFRTCATYDAGSVAFARVALGAHEPTPVVVLGPTAREQPDSSLTHMIARFVVAMGDGAREEETYFIREGVIDVVALDDRVTRLLMSDARPPIVFGTALAYVASARRDRRRDVSFARRCARDADGRLQRQDA